MVIWNVNRKSWVPDRMLSFSMTLSDPNPGVKVYLQVEYLKNGAFRDKVIKEHLIENHIQCIEWYHIQ